MAQRYFKATGEVRPVAPLSFLRRELKWESEDASWVVCPGCNRRSFSLEPGVKEAACYACGTVIREVSDEELAAAKRG